VDELRFCKETGIDEDMDIGHGRIETRKCSVVTNLQHIENKDKWPGLKT